MKQLNDRQNNVEDIIIVNLQLLICFQNFLVSQHFHQCFTIILFSFEKRLCAIHNDWVQDLWVQVGIPNIIQVLAPTSEILPCISSYLNQHFMIFYNPKVTGYDCSQNLEGIYRHISRPVGTGGAGGFSPLIISNNIQISSFLQQLNSVIVTKGAFSSDIKGVVSKNLSWNNNYCKKTCISYKVQSLTYIKRVCVQKFSIV